MYALPAIGSGQTGTFNKLSEQNLIGLRKVLDANDDLGIAAVRKLMDFYQSCMNVVKINSLGAEPLMAVIKDNGQWISLLPTVFEEGAIPQHHEHIVLLFPTLWYWVPKLVIPKTNILCETVSYCKF